MDLLRLWVCAAASIVVTVVTTLTVNVPPINTRTAGLQFTNNAYAPIDEFVSTMEKYQIRRVPLTDNEVVVRHHRAGLTDRSRDDTRQGRRYPRRPWPESSYRVGQSPVAVFTVAISISGNLKS